MSRSLIFSTRIKIELYLRFHFNSSKEKASVPLGDAQIKLKDFQPGILSPESTSNNPNEVLKVVKIINPQNGKPAGEVREVQALCIYEAKCSC